MKNMNNEIVRIFKCQCDGNIDENGEEIVEDLITQNKVEEKLKEPNFYIVNAFKYLDADQQKSIGLKLIERSENGKEVREDGKTTKQKIKDSYNQGYRDGFLDAQSQSIGGKDISEFDNAENYYNEHFKRR